MSKRKPDPARDLRDELERVREPRQDAEGDPLPRDPVAFLERYTPHEISPAWRGVVNALYGRQLVDPVEQDAFRQVAGHSTPRTSGYGELVAVAGRRSGKSETASALALYEAVVNGAAHMRYLPRGTVGHIVLVNRTQRQATENFRFARAAVERHVELAEQLDGPPLESATGGTLSFKNGTAISVLPMSKSSLRGYTILHATVDEVGWWQTGEESADEDAEVIAALRYGMAPPIGAPPRRLLVLSSPGPKAGVLWEAFSQDHGRARAARLVVHAGTQTWNPNIAGTWIEAERARDPRRYRREVEAQFVDAISAWIDAEVVDRAAQDRTEEPLRKGTRWAQRPISRLDLRTAASTELRYIGAIDMAFRRDSTALVVAHSEARLDGLPPLVVCDGCWCWSPAAGRPLVAEEILGQARFILSQYGINEAFADQFAFVPLSEAASRLGLRLVEVTASVATKAAAYGRLRELLYSSRISLPAHHRLLSELRSLEERVTSGGNIQIGAPNRGGSHDDCASALAWSMHGIELSLTSGDYGYCTLPFHLGAR